MHRFAYSLVVVALIAPGVSDGDQRFVSTKATAAKLGGLPGRPCAEPDRKQISGPCWDPPGKERAIPAATLQPGMRLVEKPDFKYRKTRATYWFEMPREAIPSYEKLPEVPSGGSSPPVSYVPYAAEGYLRPALPAMKGRTVGDVLAAVDALDMPFVLQFVYTECDAEHDRICEVEDRGPDNAQIGLVVSQQIMFRGTPDEERKLPKDLAVYEGRPTAEVVAEIKQLGFTNLNVIEKDLPCKRGVVCRMPGYGGWRRTAKVIEIWVRQSPAP